MLNLSSFCKRCKAPSNFRVSVRWWFASLCATVLLTVSPLLSQENGQGQEPAAGSQKETESDPHPLEGPDTSSPRETLRSFIEGAKKSFAKAQQEGRILDQNEHFVPSLYRMERCLDSSELPPEVRKRGVRHAAVCLKEVLDRLSLPDLATIPDSEMLNEEAADSWTIPHTEIRITLVEQGPRKGEYLFSPDSVARATQFYERIKHLPYQPGATKDLLALYVKSTESEVVAKEAAQPLEGADTSSPRTTLLSFLDACNEAYQLAQTRGRKYVSHERMESVVHRIERCLDSSEIPPAIRDRVVTEAAVCLKEVLDRVELPPVSDIPDRKLLQEQAIDRWTVPQTEITIAEVKEGPRKGEYLFSGDTVVRATHFYKSAKRLPYKSTNSTEGFYNWYLSEPGWMIPDFLVHDIPFLDDTRIYGHALWQWIGLLLTLVLGGVVVYLTYRVGRIRAQAGRRAGIIRYWISLWLPIAAMLIPLLVSYFATEQLRMSGNVLIVVKYAMNLGFTAAVIVVVIAAGNRIAEIFVASPQIHPRGVDAQLIRLVSRFVSLIVATAVFLEGGRNLGIPLTTLLAGAGVGGLALALAAQDTLKNLFGSVMIVLDKPFRVGERIVTKDYDGVVEEIGLRSTKIRLLTGHLAAIPNEELARRDIENIGRRKHIRRSANIAIPLDTPTEKAQRAVEIIRDILAEHEGLEPDYPPRVFLNEFNRDSFNIRMIYWYHPPDYWDFLAFGQNVNLQIKERFDAEGIEFALPATTTFLAQDEKRPADVKITNPSDAQTTEPRQHRV